VVARAPESEAILLLAILNDPERFSTLAFVVAIFVLRVLFVGFIGSETPEDSVKNT
jgi:hypothetical protein